LTISGYLRGGIRRIYPSDIRIYPVSGISRISAVVFGYLLPRVPETGVPSFFRLFKLYTAAAAVGEKLPSAFGLQTATAAGAHQSSSAIL